ncbi:hypothetical protein GCM10023116_43840 [Kistimonas scapharcae]|uniref:Uncharacterized protein n=1 Tax=Kistimonas scapharcae TaxID=1036133 RepID=A0ABP8VAP2_9GAMM
MFWKALIILWTLPIVAQCEEQEPEYPYQYHAEYSAAAHRIDDYGNLCLHNISLSNTVCRYFRDEYSNMLERLDEMPDHLIQDFSDPLVEWKNLYGALQNAASE